MKKAILLTGATGYLGGYLPYRKGEVMSSHTNVEPLKLRWFCKTNLDQGLNLVMEGYKQ